jgi:hypothetical protein
MRLTSEGACSACGHRIPGRWTNPHVANLQGKTPQEILRKIPEKPPQKSAGKRQEKDTHLEKYNTLNL